MSNQSGDETAILALIHRARIAVWMHDFDTYEKCFVHDADTARWNASPISGIQARQGWDPISAAARRMFDAFKGQTHHANAYDTEVVDLRIRVSGEMAWATYRQRYPETPLPPGWTQSRPWHHAGNSPSHEVRVFERHAGEWRIAFLGYLDPDSGRSNAALHGDQVGSRNFGADGARPRLPSDRHAGRREHRGQSLVGDRRKRQGLRVARRTGARRASSRGRKHRLWPLARAKDGAGHVLAGRALPEIAAMLGITANTARTHLDRIFDKTGVRTQPALVRALLSVAAPV
jgi:hypothetical protein